LPFPDANPDLWFLRKKLNLYYIFSQDVKTFFFFIFAM
jgi:hypothetical protein